MKRVYMRHPELADREPVEVPASAVPFHVNAGWEVVESPEEGGDAAEDKHVAGPRKRVSKTAAEDKKEDGS